MTSPTVQFRIGPKKESFNLHLAPITAVSEPLDCIVDDAFSKTRNKHHDNHVLLASEDPDTFARFAQYVYTRDYSEPESRIDLKSVDWEDSSTPPRSSAPVAQVTECSEAAVQVAPSELGENVGAWKKFASKLFPKLSPVEAPGPCSPSQENYNSVLIGHVKVYIFAQKYEVEGLAHLAMKKLHAALYSFTLYPERVPEISKLLRFVHLNLKNANDPLRTLVMAYAECVIMELVKDQALLVNGPESLTLELVAMLRNRANAQSSYQLDVPEILRVTQEGYSSGNVSQQAHGPDPFGNGPRIEETNQPRGEGGRGYESTYEEGQSEGMEVCSYACGDGYESTYGEGQFENLEVCSCAGGEF